MDDHIWENLDQTKLVVAKWDEERASIGDQLVDLTFAINSFPDAPIHPQIMTPLITDPVPESEEYNAKIRNAIPISHAYPFVLFKSPAAYWIVYGDAFRKIPFKVWKTFANPLPAKWIIEDWGSVFHVDNGRGMYLFLYKW